MLTICTECGGTISADAHACPHCGRPVPSVWKAVASFGQVLIWLALTGFGIMLLLTAGSR